MGDKGIVIMEMPFQPSAEYEVWRADVAVLRVEKARRIAGDEYLQGAPDLVVEVLSPSNTAQEINDKIAVCLENGCASFWVVDDKRKEVTVTEGDITKRYAQAATIPSDILGGSIRVEDIFRGL
ncbi:MAG: Uma2 family endonuclease [Acidobacteriaceae bacterium]|nr:Uma2 family endonuclease [Acidobacteriaceae bacterium]